MQPQKSTRALLDGDKVYVKQDNQLVELTLTDLKTWMGNAGLGSGGKTRYLYPPAQTPDDTIGNDGDSFIYVAADSTDSLDGNLWVRESGTYVLKGTLQGNDGQNGTNGAPGQPGTSSSGIKGPLAVMATPDSTVGNALDWAVDQTTNRLYGPKGSATARSPQHTFGINIHLGSAGIYSTQSANGYQSVFQDLGADLVRDNCASDSALTARMAKYNQWYDQAGIQMLWVIDTKPASFTQSYLTSYNAAKTVGAAWGTASLAYHGTVYVECGNELDASKNSDGSSANCRRTDGTTTYAGSINPNHIDGSVYGDYDPVRLEAVRGHIAGLVDGVKSTNPAALCGTATGGSFSNVFFDMLMNGRGTADGPTVPGIGGYTNGPVIATPINFDFTPIHFYSSQFNPTSAQSWHYAYTGAGKFNILALLNTVSGNKPIIVSEWGGGNQVESAKSADTTTYFNSYWWGLRATYNITGMIYYNLYQLTTETNNAQNYGLILSDGVTKGATYSTLKGLYTSNTTQSSGTWPNPYLLLQTLVAGIADLFQSAGVPMRMRVFNAGDKTNGDWAYLGFAADNIARVNTSKIGTGTARGLQLGFNDIDLLKLNASSLAPLTNNSYGLGTSTVRFSTVYGNIISTASQEYTSTGSLVSTSPAVSYINSAGAVILTVAAGNPGEERVFYNRGASTTSGISYTGKSGTTSYTFSGGIDKWVRIRYETTPTGGSALNAWYIIGSN